MFSEHIIHILWSYILKFLNCLMIESEIVMQVRNIR